MYGCYRAVWISSGFVKSLEFGTVINRLDTTRHVDIDHVVSCECLYMYHSKKRRKFVSTFVFLFFCFVQAGHLVVETDTCTFHVTLYDPTWPMFAATSVCVTATRREVRENALCSQMFNFVVYSFFFFLSISWNINRKYICAKESYYVHRKNVNFKTVVIVDQRWYSR